MAARRRLPEISTTGERVLGLDFTKYLLSSDSRRHITMESDNTTGTESDPSDLELGHRYNLSENSEESDDNGIYYDSDQAGTLSMFDTAIGSGPRNGDHIHQVNTILAQMNSSNPDSGYFGSLYPIREAGSTITDSSGSPEDNSEDTLSNSGSPLHQPVYGSYHKIQNQIDEARRMESDGSLEKLMLHRLPGEYLGMILGIEGGKEGNGTVTCVCVKSVTLGGAAHRATGGSKGVCVSDEIVEVNGLDLHTLTHDECVQVFKDMPLRVMLGVRRGQKNIPPLAMSPLPIEKGEQPIQRQNSNSKQNSPRRLISPQQLSDSEDDGFAGFAMYKVIIEKDGTENLGLSIVPSYGSTKQYYQIKRILPSGAAARSEQLQVGDRLITCNGKNLRGLTQNHCLNIIRTSSSYGTVTFEIIRPVYNGSSMEISVTVNPNSQNNPYGQAYDSQQYSLKSQSYDRNVDVVVTSESEDYLTVSEDEYSKSGRLANIPALEANEVFATNSVRLAFQKPFNKIEEESTATETELETVSPRDSLTKEGIDIIDLNKVDSSPYHIPKRPSSVGGYLSPRNNKPNHQNDISEISKSDLDNLSPRSPTRRSPRSPQIPKTDIDTINVSSIKSRSPIPKTDLDTRSRSPNILKSDIDNVSVSSVSPRSPVPYTDLDSFRLRTPSPVSPERVYTNSPVRTSYNKRQQVPLNENESISPPFNYQSEIVTKDIPTDIKDSVRYNPLYDSNTSEATDSETVQDVYIASPFESPEHQRRFSESNTDIENNFDYIEDVVEVALPPPLEFSDYQNTDSNEHLEYSPVTNIDDLASSSVDVSPIHQEITVRPSYRKPNNAVVKLENSFRDLEEASTDKSRDIPRDYSDRELAFNKELTAPFDSVLQEDGDCVHETDRVPVDFAHASDDEILQVVKSYDNGSVIISQFDANEKRGSSDSKTIYYSQDKTDITMDTNSEAMLKDALDMEYEHLPETNKLTTRIELAGSMQPDKVNMEEELANGRNVMAEKVAKEMLQNEGGNYGYYMESDDEPDQFPGQDEPEPEPALPDAPPPILMATSNNIREPIVQTVKVVNGDTTTDTEQSVSKESDIDNHAEPEINSNWSFRTRDADKDQNEESEIIVPVSVKRKVDIAIDNLKISHKDEDIVVPQKIERIFSIPKDFTVKDPVEDKDVSINKKKPPPVAPKPVKSPRSPVDENFNSKAFENEDTINLEPVQEDVFTVTDISEQRKKNLVKVISVVNALTAARAHEEPDIVDKIVKVDKRDLLKQSVSAFMNLSNDNKKDNVQPQNNSVNLKINGQIPPPIDEVVVSSKQGITMSSPVPERFLKTFHTDGQTSPPKQEIIVTTKQEIVKSKIISEPKHVIDSVKDRKQNSELNSDMKDNVKENINSNPVMKTSIMVEKPKNDEKVTSPKETNISGLKTNMTVPPLNLNSLTGSHPGSLSPRSDKSGETSPSSTYKTTIGVERSKPEKVSPTTDEKFTASTKDKPNLKSNVSPLKAPQFKALTAIKPLSFNPKSLSQTLPGRSVQYKTSINTVGTKPSTGLSTLGRSSLLGTQKTDHPIKRMETMPFEVSILKGILGIGIKTTMTSEGFVKISEILPSGPVGREGNIKVGDYLLSINGTQLTGLPDSKVQQTLRLLPRGLSKLVASVLPPDPDTVAPSAVEKSKLAPKQSAPLSSLRKTTVTTNPEPLTISTRKPLNITKSLPSALQLKDDDKSQQLSPRSKAPPTTLPKPKERTSLSPRGETSPRSPVIEQTVSLVTSPRQQSALSPVASPRQQSALSPRSPVLVQTVSPVTSPRQQSALSPRATKSSAPPVAPKPVRKPSGDKATPEDPNQPIETVILASVNLTKVESAMSGPNILPGSVNYDSTKPMNKIEGRKGEVSSAAFKSPSALGNTSEGKVDIVNDTDSQIRNDLTNQSPHSVTLEHSHDSKTFEMTTDERKVEESKVDDKNEADVSFDGMIKDVLEKTNVDASLLANRNRSFSTSSDNESYTEFNECNVEETEIPEDIIEVDEAEVVKSPVSDVKSEEYESDFEEYPSETADQTKNIESKENVDMNALTGMAEKIVATVMSNVVQMDLGKEEPPQLPSEESPVMEENCQSTESTPPLPNLPPPLPTEAPPPIPDQAPPPLVSDSQTLNKELVVSQLDDFSLYPDDIATEKNMTARDLEKEGEQVIDVVSSYHSAQLHAEKPLFNVVNAHIFDTPADSNDIDSISKQVPDSSRDQLDPTDEAVDDSSVNIVIDMYSDIGNVNDNANGPTNQPNIVSKEADVTESSESKLMSDIVGNNNTDTVKNNAAVNDKSDIANAKDENVVKDTPLNGHSGRDIVVKGQVLSTIDTRKKSDGGTSLSPRSDSTYSPRTPRTADSLTSEEEGHGGKYTPDVDKVIRMLSQSEEPVNKGEGEVMMITINKGVTGLGFVIEGGKMSLKGDLPISIKRIFKGGPAEHHLQVGDEICEVNGEDISQMRRTEAWNHLKFLPSGDNTMKIQRYKKAESIETDV